MPNFRCKTIETNVKRSWTNPGLLELLTRFLSLGSNSVCVVPCCLYVWHTINFYLQERPHSVQSLCLLNMERGRKIPLSYFIQLFQDGMFAVTKSQVRSQDDDNWKVDICGGTCSCPAFLSFNIPCKHMFAIFHHFPQWSWDNLPNTLTNSHHMTLDHDLTNSSEHGCTIYSDNEQEADHGVEVSACSSTSSNTTQYIPVKTTEGAQVIDFRNKLKRC